MNINPLEIKHRIKLEDFRLDFRNQTDYFSPIIMKSGSFDREVNRENIKYFVCEDNDRIVGIISIAYSNEDHVMIGYGLLSEYIGKGNGRKMIEFIDRYCIENKKLTSRANIVRSNWRSILVLVRCGYFVDTEDGEQVHLIKRYEYKEQPNQLVHEQN